MAIFKFQNKYACGAYFNMARDNFHRTFMDILHQVGFGKNYMETELDEKIADIIDALKGNSSALSSDGAKILLAQQSKMRQLLFRCFPILAPVMADIMHYRHIKKENEVWNTLSNDERDKLKEIKEKEKEKTVKLTEDEKRLKKKIEVNDDGDRDASCVDCLEALLVLGRCLTDCRNYFTHYRPFNSQEKLDEIYKRQVQVGRWLFPVFTASRRLDKKRNRLSSAEMEFITNNNMKVKTDEDGNKVKNDDGKDVYVKNHDYFFSVLGESYITEISDKNYSQKLYENDETCFGKADNNALSDFGLLYLCCCFITRPQAHLFAEKAHLFEGSPENMTLNDFNYVWNVSQEESPNMIQQKELERLKRKLKIENLNLKNADDIAKFNALKDDPAYWLKSPKNEIILEMLSIYRVRLPKGKRLDKQDNSATVALDMLNELRRCPRELYNILSPEGQKAFEDPAESVSGGTSATTDRIRYTDRFPYLALRAIDEMQMLPSIRFQVQLGYYRFSFYDKTCIDGTQQLRRIGKAVNGFGRLSTIESLRKQTWSPSENDAETQEANKMQRKVYAPTLLEDGKTTLDLLRPVEDHIGNAPYITDSVASYNIHNNRIGLYWEKEDDRKLKTDDVLLFPELKANDKDKLGRRKAEVPQKAPLCSLSIRDLPAMLFLIHLSYGKAAEDIIVKKYNGLLQFFTDLCREPNDSQTEPTFESIKNDVVQKGLEAVLAIKRYNLRPSDLPERIRDCFGDKEQEKSVGTNCDAIGYFRKRLIGTAYELAEDITIEEVKQLVTDLGNRQYDERYGGLPTRKRPPKTPESICKEGLEKVLLLAKRYDEAIPEGISSLFIKKEDNGIEDTNNKPNAIANHIKEMLLGNKKDPNNPNSGRLERRIQWIDRQLMKFKAARQQQFAKDNRYGTKSYKDVRYGRLAELLAESMLMWQPTVETDSPVERGTNKLTGLNYRRLVDFLATYSPKSAIVSKQGEKLEGIAALTYILRESTLIESEQPHPFLQDVLAEKENKKTPKNIEELFQFYMESEKMELIRLEELFQKMGDDTPLAVAIEQAPAFVHPKRERWQYDNSKVEDVRKMAAKYIKPDNALLLPDGLFTDAIVQLLKQKGLLQDAFAEAEMETDEDRVKLLQERNRNVSFLISRYIEEQGDHCQSFYDGEAKQFYRGYDLFKKLFGAKQGNEQLHKYLPRTGIATMLKEKKSLENKINQYCITKKKPEAKEGMMRDICRIKKNERAILRYKTQDIILFLTAKKMLQEQQELRDRNIVTDNHQGRRNLGRQTIAALDRKIKLELQRREKINQMKLQDVFDGDALNVTMDYEYQKQVTWKKLDEQGRVVMVNNGHVIPYDKDGRLTEKDGKPIVYTRKIYITQQNVAVKNFGRIFRIINDARLDDLLVLLITRREGRNPQTTSTGTVYYVSAAELANEFSLFDSKRIDAFEVIHGLEKTAYPKLKNPQSDETFQFKNMMRLICSEEEADAINQYRISFAHSKYGVSADTFGTEITLEVPVVSEKMKEQIQLRSDAIKKKRNK